MCLKVLTVPKVSVKRPGLESPTEVIERGRSAEDKWERVPGVGGEVRERASSGAADVWRLREGEVSKGFWMVGGKLWARWVTPSQRWRIYIRRKINPSYPMELIFWQTR